MEGQNSTMSKQIKLWWFFAFNGFKPLYHRCRVSPLVELGCSRDFVVDSVEDCFADSANIGFGGVDQSAGRFVSEVRFVVPQCYE